MFRKSESITNKLLKLVLCYSLFFAAALFPAQSYAIYDGPRSTSYIPSQSMEFMGQTITVPGHCDVGTIDFDPFMNNQDINWELTNPTCMGFIIGTGASLLAAEFASSYACLQPQLAAEAAAQHASGVPMSPTMIKRRAQEAAKCGALLSAQAWGQAAACCGGLAATLAVTGIAISVLAIIWDQANSAFENAKICGSDWIDWKRDEEDPTLWKREKGPRFKCLEELFLGKNYGNAYDSFCYQNSSPSITNVSFREFIYGGKEYVDGNGCGNPVTWDAARRMEILGYTDGSQRYYMTGAGNAPVYACYRFLANPTNQADRSAMQVAYDCCKRRSQETICIENKNNVVVNLEEHKFCTVGSKCTVAAITFEVYQSLKNPNYGCAKTYSVCPYNHLLGGGTEEEELNAIDPSRIDNFCQVFKHCSKLPILPYIYNSGLQGGYISQACRDLKGDSQNVYGYTAQLLPINTRGFSAPLVQCFKETMENVFLHKAGHSLCSNPDELPINDECVSGYIYKKGGDLPGKSFFLKIQDNLQDVIKMALIASVIAFGFAILMAVPGAHITKKVLIGYVLKIGLIMYFAIGDAWQFGFMQGLLGTSSFMADLTFRVDEDKPQNKLDGCQFPRFDYNDDNPYTKYDNPKYPPTKEYLRIWDTLDCKIARALGFGPDVSVPNLVMAIIGGFFTGGLGIIFFVATFIFAFFLISMTIKAMHIFIMSITSVIILLYVSPITITLAFFERTKGIFQGWWKQILGFTLQPMILFAYMGIMISVLDNFILGSATFSPATVEINGASVVDTYGRISPKQISCAGDAKDDSLYCIFRFADIKTFNGFEPLGIGIPLLTSLNSDKLDTIFKSAMVLFILSTFMDKIMQFASALVGGAALESDWGSSASKLLGSAYGIGRGVQARGIGMMRKHGAKPIKGVGKVGRNIAQALTFRGKKIGDPSRKSEVGDHVSKSNTATSDSVAKGDKGASDSVAKGKGSESDSTAISFKPGKSDAVGSSSNSSSSDSVKKIENGAGNSGDDNSRA